jgi:hypothetical protein
MSLSTSVTGAPSSPGNAPAPESKETGGAGATSREEGAGAPDAGSTAVIGAGDIERRPGEPASEARARALGLLEEADDGGVDAREDGDEADDQDAAESERFPWQRPEGLSDDELAEWKEKQGLPQTAEDYEIELPEGQTISEAGRPIVDSFLAFAAEHDLPEATVSKAIQWFSERQVELQAERETARKEGDRASKQVAEAALQDRWGTDDYAENLKTANAGLKTLPKELRSALREARLPDGSRLQNMPELIELLYSIGAAQEGEDAPSTDRKEIAGEQRKLRAELAELETLRSKDIHAYRGPWKNTGKTGSDRAVEIMKALEGISTGDRPSPREQKAALAAEERELMKLKAADPDVFRWRPWRKTGRTGAERLHDIRVGRA